MAWYKDWFGEDYLKVYPHRDEAEARRQVEFVEEIIPLPLSGRILDLGCGSGRHSAELSKRGYNVTCLDLSPVLLRVAKRKSKGEKCCRQFVRADMRCVPFFKVFDTVVSFFTTFGYFDTTQENLKTLTSIESVLKPGGHFLLDYLNKSHVINNLVASDTRQGDGGVASPASVESPDAGASPAPSAAGFSSPSADSRSISDWL